MSLFIHLRACSDFSFGASNLKFKQIIMKCHDFKMPAIGIADNNMFGALEFAMGASASGVQPIIGYSVYVDYSNLKLSSKSESKNQRGEVLLIAKSEIGYKNLLKIASRACVDRHDTKSVEWHFLAKHSDGLIALFGGLHEDKLLHKVIALHGIAGAKRLFELLQSEMKLEPFIELTRYSDGRHINSERALTSIAYEMHIPLVATNPINFLKPENYESCEALFCIINTRYLGETDRPRINPEHYYKTQEEMISLFSDLPEAIDNTVLIAKKCHFFPSKQKIMIPKFDISVDANEEIERVSTAGLEERIKGLDIDRDKYFARLRFELDLIQKMNFSDYFLIVSDFIQWSKDNGIAVGPGRGSGAGSIVAWCLKITELDPIEFGLLFERFLNPERISMPDFDIDFCQLRREEVLHYIVEKYGQDRIAHIITFGKLQPRAVLRDVGRVLQMPYGLIDKICKMIPQNQANPVTLQQAIDLDRQLQRMRAEEDAIDRLLTIGLELEGCHRNISTHAAGVIIAENPIVEVMPLYKDPDSGMLSGQFSMKYVESAGLIKFDFLGLKTLTVISNARKLIKSSSGVDVNMNEIPQDDPSTYKMLSEGGVLGVFQLEGSAGIREAVKQMKPDQLSDIIALTSLYRPGPMENIPTYVARKHGSQAVDVIHPDLKEVLSETYGIIVYQEQVIKIAQILAGYSLGEADILRRAMGKKDKYEMQQQRSIFVSRSVERGLSEEKAEQIFDLVNKFASYGFNKAHAAAYAVVTYQTAYLKQHYLVEFLVSSINLEIHSPEKVSAFCDEAKTHGIEVRKPDINESTVFFSIEVVDAGKLYVIENDITNFADPKVVVHSFSPNAVKKIRYGLAGIKGTGVKALGEIISERKRNGKFKDLYDFLKRTASKGFNKRLFEQLIRSGALEELYPNSNELLQNIDRINQYVGTLAKEKQESARQISLLDIMNGVSEEEAEPSFEITSYPEWSKADKLQAEHKALGFYLTEHPVLLYADILKKQNIMYSTEINHYVSSEPREIGLAGVVQECKIRSGKGEKAGKYAFLCLVDPYGPVDVSIFDSNILNNQAALLASGNLVFCRATIRNDAQGQRILLRSIKPLMDAIEDAIPSFEVTVRDIESVERLHELIQREIQKESRSLKLTIVASCIDGSSVKFSFKKELFVSHEFIGEVKGISRVDVSEKEMTNSKG